MNGKKRVEWIDLHGTTTGPYFHCLYSSRFIATQYTLDTLSMILCYIQVPTYQSLAMSNLYASISIKESTTLKALFIFRVLHHHYKINI